MKLYVNWAFLENLFLADEETECHFFIKRLLKGPQAGVEVILDEDLEAAYKDPEKKIIARQLAQRLPLTDTTFPKACQTRTFHESGEPKLLFVDKLPLDVDKRFGCFWTSTNTLDRAAFLFHAEPFRIHKSQRDWSVLQKIKHPCNAIVLTDNYLFKNDKSYENIVSVLTSLMPDSLAKDFTFDLTIIGYSDKDFADVKKQADNVLESLKKKFPYNINLSIIRADHHGRYIHTNYYRIFSEKGFGLFRNGKLPVNDETSLDCQPVTLSGLHSSVLSIRRDELKRCKAIRQVERMPDKIAGTCANRLLC